MRGMIQPALSGLLVMVLVTPLDAQQRKTTSAVPGAVSGRVFAITNSGDLKPARMAKVYLLWCYSNLKFALEQEKKGINEDTAALVFMRARNEAMEQDEIQRKQEQHWDDFINCRRDLLEYDHGIVAAMRWCTTNRKLQMLLTEADEDGSFRIPDVPPGVYDLVVRGRAGFNEAAWSVGFIADDGQDHITVPPGKEVMLKGWATWKLGAVDFLFLCYSSERI
jgi:hypothetical protein